MKTLFLPLMSLFLMLANLVLPMPADAANASDAKVTLSAPAEIRGLKGTAKYRNRGGEQELQVEIEASKKFAGAVYAVVVDETVAGQVTLDAFGKGRLVLNNRRGQIVPAVVPGSNVRVLAGDGSVVLAGRF